MDSMIVMIVGFIITISIFGVHVGVYLISTRRAVKRARTLLRRLLTEEQRQQYDRGARIIVPFHDGYAAIGTNISGVLWVNTGNYNRSYNYKQCVAISNFSATPIEDDLIAKLLWLRSDPHGLKEGREGFC